MNKILVIDIETTGFQKQGGSIVEVGIVELDLVTGATEIVIDSLCREDILDERHFREPMGWIFKNSTLRAEEVMAAPRMGDLLPEIQKIVNAYPVGATAYNRSFDFDFLKSRGVRFGVELPCPMKLSTPICQLPPFRYGSYKWPKVEEAWAEFFPNEEYVELHRGADDALHEARIVHELYRRGVFVFK